MLDSTPIFQTNFHRIPSKFYWLKSSNHPMAEASMAVYGAVIGVAIALAVVTFALRGKWHTEPLD